VYLCVCVRVHLVVMSFVVCRVLLDEMHTWVKDIYTYINIYTCIRIYKYIYIHIYTYTYICIHMYTFAFKCKNVYMNIYISYINIYVYTYVHLYT